MTPGQFKSALDGYKISQENNQRLAAFTACCIINYSGNVKEPIEINDLLPSKVERKVVKNIAEEHERIKAKFGVK